jgi:hypothetical protein
MSDNNLFLSKKEYTDILNKIQNSKGIFLKQGKIFKII